MTQPPRRYAVLRHEGVEGAHFDLLFEMAPGSMLAAFRSEVWPIVGRTPLIKIADHRAIYLDYEGEISGNRGRVRRVEGGTFTQRGIDDFENELVLESAGGVSRLILGTRTRGVLFKSIDGYEIWPVGGGREGGQ